MNVNIGESFTLETARFLLRIPHEKDFPAIFSATRYEGFNDGMLWDPPKHIDELKAPLERALQAWEEGKAFQFTITRKPHDQLIGRISIRNLGEAQVWDVGFWTHPEAQNKGVMTETLGAVLRFGFETLQAERIEGAHAVWNKASEKVMKNNGMQFVRYIEQAFQKKGLWVAENMLAIQREDWINASWKPRE